MKQFSKFNYGKKTCCINNIPHNHCALWGEAMDRANVAFRNETKCEHRGTAIVDRFWNHNKCFFLNFLLLIWIWKDVLIGKNNPGWSFMIVVIKWPSCCNLLFLRACSMSFLLQFCWKYTFASVYKTFFIIWSWDTLPWFSPFLFCWSLLSFLIGEFRNCSP